MSLAPARALPAVDGDRGMRLRAPLAAAAAIGVATLALRARDPHQHGSWGLCPFKAITGFDCPGCGGLRAVNDLTHIRLADAWHSNALFLALIPLIAAWWGWAIYRGWTGSSAKLSARMLRTGTAVGIAVMIGFTVFRNTPWGAAFYAS